MATLYTIGHSNRKLQEFVDLLTAYKISKLVDIRTIPKSRYVPWFNKESLAASLKKLNIQYQHMPALGGLRSPKADSINLGWHNLSFRAYADYMQTKEFFSALKALNALLSKERVVIMCAEAVPWRCHRSLIADAEIIRHLHVFHIMSENTVQAHHLTPFAVVNKDRRPMQIYYPEPKQ
ncbi:DUF488 domain-containing protein [Legionella clemsonensis]|uniref:DUF488 domain-containing protein n=1 Tax=Legionella clemsonensis TaxID=1867846 RepID=A0A222P047_9GAMM|nr:DUF488 domain-containing protein [Legionella clemsonensis]ASQ45209.1 hypothetical protein clem_03255 [Legionella clemsonensis]